jgi:hypothetical protein
MINEKFLQEGFDIIDKLVAELMTKIIIEKAKLL